MEQNVGFFNKWTFQVHGDCSRFKGRNKGIWGWNITEISTYSLVKIPRGPVGIRLFVSSPCVSKMMRAAGLRRTLKKRGEKIHYLNNKINLVHLTYIRRNYKICPLFQKEQPGKEFCTRAANFPLTVVMQYSGGFFWKRVISEEPNIF